MKSDEVHLVYENENYFIKLPEEYDFNGSDENIMAFLKKQGISPLYEVYVDHRNRYLEIIVDKDLSFLSNTTVKDCDVRVENNGSTYLLHIPSMTIICHNKVWLDIVDKAWKNGQK
jgi:hypothetical protein